MTLAMGAGGRGDKSRARFGGTKRARDQCNNEREPSRKAGMGTEHKEQEEAAVPSTQRGSQAELRLGQGLCPYVFVHQGGLGERNEEGRENATSSDIFN